MPSPAAYRPASSTRRLRAFALAVAVILPVAAGCEVPNPGPSDTVPDRAGLASAIKTTGRYGPDARFNVYDLYKPRTGRPATGYPLVIFIHGGAWIGGSRSADLRAFGESVTSLTSRGWAVASIDYRLVSTVPQVNYEAPIQDVKRAVRFFKAKASDLGLDRTTFILAGHSAGGHLAALAALSCMKVNGVVSCEPSFEPTNMPADVAAQNSSVQGLITLAPVLDLATWATSAPAGAREAVNTFLGCQASAATSVPTTAPDTADTPASVCNPTLATTLNPTTWLDASDPSWYMAHGSFDTMVPAASQTLPAYEKAVSALGDSRVWLDIVNDKNHDIPGVNATAVAMFAEKIRTRNL